MQSQAGVKLHINGRYRCGSTADVKGDLFKYTGVQGQQVGVVKILLPMNPTLNYFEYEIISTGVNCAIGIGVGESEYPLNRMPGWNRNGVGYHADDGKLFYQNGRGMEFGPTCTAGDRMGCGVDFESEDCSNYMNVFFTKNGRQIGDLIKIKKPMNGLYPLVGLHTQRAQVRYLGHRHCSLKGIYLQCMHTILPQNLATVRFYFKTPFGAVTI